VKGQRDRQKSIAACDCGLLNFSDPLNTPARKTWAPIKRPNSLSRFVIKIWFKFLAALHFTDKRVDFGFIEFTILDARFALHKNIVADKTAFPVHNPAFRELAAKIAELIHRRTGHGLAEPALNIKPMTILNPALFFRPPLRPVKDPFFIAAAQQHEHADHESAGNGPFVNNHNIFPLIRIFYGNKNPPCKTPTEYMAS
jgi:hypothetical protein